MCAGERASEGGRATFVERFGVALGGVITRGNSHHHCEARRAEEGSQAGREERGRGRWLCCSV